MMSYNHDLQAKPAVARNTDKLLNFLLTPSNRLCYLMHLFLRPKRF